MAWQWPLLVTRLTPSETITGPAGSKVAWAQKRLVDAAQMALACVANDVQIGLQETVGIHAQLAQGERASVIITLPVGTDTNYIAQAIDLENVEAWCDENGQVHAAIGPWYTTKDVDQVVLSITKVVHVLLGLHAKYNGANN